MMKRNKLHFAAVALTCLTLAVPAELPAQSNSYSRNTQLSKRYWNLWRTGFESYEAGESALLAGRNEEAADCYRRALNAFQTVRKNNPNWNKNVINYRISLADRRLKTALRRLEYQNAGAAREYGSTGSSAEATRKLQEKIKALQDSLAESERINLNLRKLAEQGKVARDQVVDLLKEKKEIEKKYEALVLQYNETKRTAASASAGTSSLEKAFKREQSRSEALLKIVEELRKESRELQAKFQRAENELERDNRKLRETSKELVAAKKTDILLKDLQKRYKRMEQDLNNKLDTIKNELKIEQNKLAAKTKECETLRKDQSSAARKLAEESERLRNQAFALKKDIDFLKESIKNKDKLLNEASNREMRLNSMVASLNEKNKNTETRLKDNASSLASERKKVQQSEQKLAVLNAENKDLKAKIKLLAEQVNKIPVVTAAAEGEKLKARQDIKRLTQQVEASTKELASVKQQLAKANRDLAAANRNLAAANQKLAKANSDLATAKKNYESSNQALEAVRKTDEIRKQKIEQLERSLAALKKSSNAKDEAAKLRISQLEKSITDFKVAAAGKDEASKLNVKLQELLDMTRKQLAEQKVAAAGKDDAIKQSRKLQQQLDQIRNQQKTAAAGKAEADKQNKKLQEQIAQLKKDLEAQKTTSANAQREKASELQAKIDSLTKRCAALTAELKKVSTEQKQADEKLVSAQKSSGDLQKTIQSIKEDRDVLAERNKKLSKDLLNTQALLEKARLQAQDDTKLRAAEKARDGWKDRTDAANKKNAELANVIQAEKAKFAKLQTAMAELEKTRDSLRNKLQRTESELEGWKKNQNTISKKELDNQVKATDSITNELRAKISEISQLKKKLMESEALSMRYRQHLQTARDVTEKAIAESRKLRNELAMYRRNDPYALPEVKKAKDMPGEIKSLTNTPNDVRDRVSKVDTDKYDKLMAQGEKLENEKKYDDALWQYWAAADAGVNRPEPYIAISRIHAIRKNPEQGIKTYERALRLGGKRVPAIEKELKQQLIDKKKAQ